MAPVLGMGAPRVVSDLGFDVKSGNRGPVCAKGCGGRSVRFNVRLSGMLSVSITARYR